VVTSFTGDVTDYEWSPDGQRIVLIVMDEDPAQKDKAKDKTAHRLSLTAITSRRMKRAILDRCVTT
jgi:hypothetical protein